MRLKNTFVLSPAIPLPATSKGAIQVTLSDSHTFLLTSFFPHRLRKKLRTAGASSCPSPPPTAPRRQKPTPNCPSGQDEAARVRELAQVPGQGCFSKPAVAATPHPGQAARVPGAEQRTTEAVLAGV